MSWRNLSLRGGAFSSASGRAAISGAFDGEPDLQFLKRGVSLLPERHSVERAQVGLVVIAPVAPDVQLFVRRLYGFAPPGDPDAG